jgi:hypothetical protein
VANFAGENDPCGLYADRLANVQMFSIPNGELYKKIFIQVLSQVVNFAGEHDPCGLYTGWLANVEMFSVPKGEFYNEMLSSGVVPSGEFCWRARPLRPVR